MADEPAPALAEEQPPATDASPAPAEAPPAADSAPAAPRPTKAAAPAQAAPEAAVSDPEQEAGGRVAAAFLDSVRNSPASRSTEVWSCLVETAVPAIVAAVIKEL